MNFFLFFVVVVDENFFDYGLIGDVDDIGDFVIYYMFNE